MMTILFYAGEWWTYFPLSTNFMNRAGQVFNLNPRVPAQPPKLSTVTDNPGSTPGAGSTRRRNPYDLNDRS